MINIYKEYTGNIYPFKRLHENPDINNMFVDAYISFYGNNYITTLDRYEDSQIKVGSKEGSPYLLYKIKSDTLDNYEINYYKSPSDTIFCYLIIDSNKKLEPPIDINLDICDKNIYCMQSPIINFEGITDEINLEEGYNITYDTSDNIIINCISGAGKGLYKPQYQEYNFIRRLFGTKAEYGNINIIADECIRIVSNKEDHSLSFINDCDQCIDCEEIRRLWEALRKIIDKYKELAQKAQEYRQQLNDLIELHNSQFASSICKVDVMANRNENDDMINALCTFANNSGCTINSISGSISISGDYRNIQECVLYIGTRSKTNLSTDSMAFSINKLYPREIFTIKLGLWGKEDENITINFTVHANGKDYIKEVTI